VTPRAYALAANAIVRRELLRFVHQRERFLSALVRPLIWLIAFGTGFREIVRLPPQPPYVSDVPSSLYMVHDREMGSMRVLLTAPLPRPFLLFSKLVAGTVVSIAQVYAFLAVAALLGIRAPTAGYVAVLPALVLTGMTFGAFGMLLSSTIRQLENFAGVMNFVIFPAFFFSSALYPLWKIRATSEVVWWICLLNPFGHAVELLRHALWADMNWTMTSLVLATGAVVFAAAVRGYDPARGFQARVRAGQ